MRSQQRVHLGTSQGLWSLAACLCLISVLACRSPAPQDDPQAGEGIAFEGRTMGTYYAVQVTGKWSPEQKVEFQEAVEAELDEVNGSMSTYLDDSEISRFNRHPGAEPFEASQALFDVMAAALEIGEFSGGAYDVTIGPLVNAWGFGPGGDQAQGQVAEATIQDLLSQVGYRKVTLDVQSATLSKTTTELSCDLSSIAKGYAVDRLAERLAALGATDYWLEVGGEIRTAGVNFSGKTWRLGIERPHLMPGMVQRLLPLDDASVATSGDYRNYREIDGERFSHIIDPRTGRPIRHRLASVSVVHAQCMIADGWATALMVMGLDEGYRVAVEQDLAVLFLVRDGNDFLERTTPAFDRLTPTSEPEK